MPATRPVDLTVAAVPLFFGSMAAERRWLRAHRDDPDTAPAQYEPRDTRANLTMGTLSLLAPIGGAALRRRLEWGRGRWAAPMLGLAAGAAALATAADTVARRTRRRRLAERAHRVAGPAAVVAMGAGGAVAASTWGARMAGGRLWQRRWMPDLGRGPLALGAAVLGWDFIYYWNHRFMHESRFMWAIHVVHHSSRRYNLSVALRQPVADAFGLFLPYGLLCLLGVRPSMVETARGINLIYQYWIHTETIRTLGPLEEVLNTASHHRVHHGVNPQYLDRNHGSILIVWDRLFGTFEREHERVRYGLTRNIDSYDPVTIAGHEYADMARDVAAARTWRERLSFVLRGPGWAYAHRAGHGDAGSEAQIGAPEQPMVGCVGNDVDRMQLGTG